MSAMLAEWGRVMEVERKVIDKCRTAGECCGRAKMGLMGEWCLVPGMALLVKAMEVVCARSL